MEATKAESNGHAESFEPRERHFPQEEAITNNVNVHSQLSIPAPISLCSSKTVPQASNGRVNQSPRHQEGITKEIKVRTKPPTPDHRDLFSSRVTAQTGNGLLEAPSLQPRDAHDMKHSQKKPVEVIDLSDDDEQQQTPRGRQHTIPDTLDSLTWHYLDPQGRVQGPFSLRSLKRWRDAKYFNDTFRVWRTDQRPHDSVLLTDILRQFFPS